MNNGQRQDISQTLMEAIIPSNNDSPNDASSSATSQSEKIANLKREIERITAERDQAVRRARARHKEMMHANRSAERATTALDHETIEREGQKIRMTALISSYKIRIHTLELSTRHTEDSTKRIQALETANATLSAALAQQREATTKAQLSAQMVIQDRIEAYKTRVVKEIEQVYKERLTAAEKQISDHATHKAETQSLRFKAKVQSLESENQELREQLKALPKTVQWHKAHTKQVTPQDQSSHMVAGIHTRFSPHGRHDSAQVKVTPKKRKRSEPATLPMEKNSLLQKYSNTQIPKSERQHGHFNPNSSNLTTTPTRQVPGLSKSQYRPQRTVTPTRRNTSGQNQQLLVNTNTAQAPQYIEPQGHLNSMQALHEHYQPNFSQCLHQPNFTKLNASQAQMNAAEAMPYFNTHTTCIDSPDSFIPTSILGGPKPMLPQQELVAGRQVLSESEAPKNVGTPVMLGPQDHAPLQDQSPRSGEVKEMQQTMTVCGKQQLAHGRSHESNARSEPDFMSLLASNPTYDFSGLPHSTSSQTQAIPSQTSGDFSDPTLAYDMSSQPPYVDLQMLPEISRDFLEGEKSRGENTATVWGSLMPSRKDGFSRSSSSSNGVSFLDDLDFPSLLENSVPYQTAELENRYDRSTKPAYLTEAASHDRSHQETYSDILQQSFEPNNVDLHHISKSQSQYAIPSTSFSQTSDAELSAPISRVNSIPCSPAPTPHQTTARKYPAPAPSARSNSVVSRRSSTNQAVPPFPVCLHCHESWWNESCDVSEPCRNCIGSHTACERPKCLNFAKGMCSHARCARVHEGDLRFDFVVDRPKTLKRVGKKDERKRSPVERALRRA